MLPAKASWASSTAEGSCCPFGIHPSNAPCKSLLIMLLQKGNVKSLFLTPSIMFGCLIVSTSLIDSIIKLSVNPLNLILLISSPLAASNG